MTRRVDYPLLISVILLWIIGVLTVFSASAAISDRSFGSIYYYTVRHMLYGVLGLAVLFVTSRLPYRLWRKISLMLLILAVVLLSLVFFPPIGFKYGGASRWLDFGPFSFQPSEFLKISFILYLSGWLTKKREEPKDVAHGFIPFIVMLGVVSVFLILQPDIGTLLVISFSAAILYFLGGGKITQLIGLTIMGLAGILLLVQLAPYRMDRLLVFLSPGVDPQGIGYHLNQAFIAIGSGGFWGRGVGHSLQKYQYLPEPMGDSIFAIFVEELGFIGALILIGIFLFFFWRSMIIIRRAPDFFSKLVSAGIASSILFQAFINMASISGLLPLTGIPLPFISYGGTALVITLFSIGILLNISRYI